MPHLQTELADLLLDVDRPGSYYATGQLDIHIPRLLIEGIGPVALPLLPMQAEQIAAAAEQAPYGRGSDTLVDTQVRNCRQVDAARVTLGGRGWEADLARFLYRTTQELSVTGSVRAEFYKLLLYGKGGFFVPHRDSEKAPGMFGTLVIVLPSDFAGGELVIQHNGETATLALQPDDPTQACFAAFYADCRHEVRPVTGGHRLALVYNLIREGGGDLPQAPDYGPQQSRIAALLRDWHGEPDKLVYPLEHAYTQAELGFDALKGADAAVASVLREAARAAGCDCHLALLTIQEYGWGEYAGYRGGEIEYEIGEVTNDDRLLHDWRHPDGSRLNFGAMPFSEQEISPLEALDDLDDTEAEFSEATGNEGVSFERFYQRAALVIWPRGARARILAGAGLDVALPFMADLVERWAAAAATARDDLRLQALELANQIRQHWPTDRYARNRASADGHTRALLGALERLGDLDQRLAFVADNMLDGAYGAADNPALPPLLARLPQEQAGNLLRSLIAANSQRIPSACAQLLRLCSDYPDLSSGQLAAAAAALLDNLPSGDAASSAKADPSLAGDTLIALERIDGALAGRAVAQMLADPRAFPMDRVLLPAALTLRETAEHPEPASYGRLRQAVLTHLQQRIDLSLEPPQDWSRPVEVKCGCGRCAELKRFLAAPDQPRWGLRANQQERDHVSHVIRESGCDLDTQTEQRGRPYTLWCTKNQASYERRVKQRERDLAHRKLLSD